MLNQANAILFVINQTAFCASSLADSMEVRWTADVSRFMKRELIFLPSLRHRSEAFGAERVITLISIVPAEKS